MNLQFVYEKSNNRGIEPLSDKGRLSVKLHEFLGPLNALQPTRSYNTTCGVCGPQYGSTPV